MRPLLLALAVLACSPAVAAAQEVVRLAVGERYPGVGTVRPICDAPSVATIVDGAILAVAPGETICSAASIQAQGSRRVFRVIVTAAARSGRGERGGSSSKE